GALVSTVGIFLPSFLLVALVIPWARAFGGRHGSPDSWTASTSRRWRSLPECSFCWPKQRSSIGLPLLLLRLHSSSCCVSRSTRRGWYWEAPSWVSLSMSSTYLSSRHGTGRHTATGFLDMFRYVRWASVLCGVHDLWCASGCHWPPTRGH